jgi:nicotinamidase-related amidase
MNVALNEARREDGVTPWACVPGTPGYEIVPELDPRRP